MLSGIRICYLRRFRSSDIVENTASQDPRLHALRAWIDGLDGINDVRLEPASDDASFRRYFRLHSGDESFIAMDAPPGFEDVRPFVAVAGMLDSMGINAPTVLASDEQAGFLLLSDLGDTQYLDKLRHVPTAADDLYTDALTTLEQMQSQGGQFLSQLPPYDEALLRQELALFSDWLCGEHLDLQFTAEEQQAWRQLCDRLVDNALAQPRVFVHRDYHSRNLMVCEERNPGVLDFQDAVEGPLCYDLVSLLKDCYIAWPVAEVRRLALEFHARSAVVRDIGIGADTFLRCFDLSGVQRHLKAAGIFCRLCHRDGKARYLDDVPLALQYVVELGGEYPELEFIVRLIADKVLPSWSNAA